jgi:ferrochelatase
MALGGEKFGLIPCLNDDDQHADALAGVVSNQLKGWV